MKHGFVLLLALLILGAVSLLVAATLLLLGVDATRTSGSLLHSMEARSLADACAEIALDVIKFDASFAGEALKEFESGRTECRYAVAKGDATHRQIFACGEASEAIRRVNLLVTRSSGLGASRLIVDQWQEAARFTPTTPYAPAGYAVPALCQTAGS